MRGPVKKVGLLIFSLVLALTGVEVALRVLNYDPNTHPFWRYHADLGWVIREKAHFDSVNSNGFRHSPVDLTKPPGTKRVLVLGDSFSLATSFEYAKTFPGRLERLLSENDRWEVVAMAVDDWGWAQQLIALERYGLAYDPDFVVSQLFPLNDFCNICLATANTCSMQDQQRPYFVLRGHRLQLTWLHPWRKALRDRFQLAAFAENLLDNPWKQARNIAGDQSEHPELSGFFEHNARKNGLRYPDAIQALLPPGHQQQELIDCWKVGAEIMARMASKTAEQGAIYLAVVIPFLYTFEEKWSRLEELSSAPIDPLYASTHTEQILSELQVHAVSMRERIELSGVASDNYFISPTDGHLSEFGHAQLASWVFEAIGEGGIKD
jgi:hypothetical protein